MKKKVVLEFKQFTVEVEYEKDLSNNEIVDLALDKLRKDVSQKDYKFPYVSYSIKDTNSLTLEDIVPGMIVTSIKDNKHYLIEKINKSSFGITGKNGIKYTIKQPTFILETEFNDFEIFEEPNCPESFKLGKGDLGWIKIEGKLIPHIITGVKGNNFVCTIVNDIETYRSHKGRTRSRTVPKEMVKRYKKG